MLMHSGTVEHQEWNTTVDFFLELKEEEAAIRDHHAKGSLADKQKKLRGEQDEGVASCRLEVSQRKINGRR